MLEGRGIARLVVPRERWLRGEKGGRLMDPTGWSYCILGHYAKACGVESAALRACRDLTDLPIDERKKIAPIFVRRDGEMVLSPFALQALEINDTVWMSNAIIMQPQPLAEEAREAGLINLFQNEIGTALSFVNEPEL